MRKICFYHAGCPDGFGAAWAAWKAWGDTAQYRACGHDDLLDAEELRGARVVFADIAPPNEALRALLNTATEIVVLDHHVSSLQRFEADPRLQQALRDGSHTVRFDLQHSGAVLAWNYLHDCTPPALLRYVEDQDVWSWKLPHSHEINAAIASYPRRFDVWNELAARSPEELAREGAPIARAQRLEVEQALRFAHTARVGEHLIEAVNARALRSAIGHALAERAACGLPWGLVYRLQGQRVDATLYSIGDLDVAKIAAEYGGGGHRNAAGFHVSLEEWLRNFA